MDKNDMLNGKMTHARCDAHRLPKGMREIHKNYGLWILGYGSYTSPVNGYHTCPMRYFEFFSISHLRSGKGRLWLPPDHECDISPGQCVVVAPRQVNRYGGVDGEPYVEDTICFTGPVADMLFRSGVLRTGVFVMGEARRLLPIQKMALDPAVDSQINANIALQKLLVDIYNENRLVKSSVAPHSSSLDKLLETLKGQIDRWWTVEEMADFCRLSKDHFRRVFKKRTGMLPKAYLDRMRLMKAAEMLISTNHSVEEIARRLAYVDAYHFSRRFKQVMGFSPTCYRREFRPDQPVFS